MDINRGLEIFQYGFMVRAFIAGSIIGVIAPLIGVFLVTRRYALMADSLAHISLAGIAIGVLTGMNPVYTALVVTIISAIIIEKLRSERKISGETALAMFLSGGLAVAVVLMSLAHGMNVDLFSYLFGSITTVRESDVRVMGMLGMLVVLAVYFFYDEFLYISFSEESAQVSGIPVRFLNMVLMVLTAITVSLAMRIVGLLLIGALMVIPVVTAMQAGKSFIQTLFLAIGFGLVSVVSGLFVSYYANVSAGGTIVVVALVLFGITSAVSGKKHSSS